MQKKKPIVASFMIGYLSKTVVDAEGVSSIPGWRCCGLYMQQRMSLAPEGDRELSGFEPGTSRPQVSASATFCGRLYHHHSYPGLPPMKFNRYNDT